MKDTLLSVVLIVRALCPVVYIIVKLVNLREESFLLGIVDAVFSGLTLLSLIVSIFLGLEASFSYLLIIATIWAFVFFVEIDGLQYL